MRPSHSEEQWNTIKPFLKQLYLDDDKSIRTVKKLAEQQKNFVVTEQKLRDQFHQWGWRKRISEEIYMAMNVLLQENSDIKVFQIINGEYYREVQASRVEYEAKRLIKTAERKSVSPPSSRELQDAITLLKQYGVSVPETDNGGETDPDSSVLEKANSQEQFSTILTTQASLQEQLQRNLDPDVIRILSPPQSSSSDDILHAFPERLARWESSLGVQLDTSCCRLDLDSSQQPNIELATYYTQPCLAGFESFDHFDHTNRVEARKNLTDLLQHNNPHLLPTIFWISTILEAYQNMSAFYEDCWACVITTSNPVANVLRFVVLCMILKIKEIQKHLGRENLSLFSGAQELPDLQSTFSQCASDLTSETEAPQISLILQSYHAWYYQQKGNAYKPGLSLEILLKHLPRSDEVFGVKHLVTINILYLVAQAYAKQNNFGLAENYIRFAVCQLQGCAKPLRAYQFHLLARLPELQLAQGEVQAAWQSLEEVLRFHVSTFGELDYRTRFIKQIVGSFVTWRVSNLQCN